MTNNRLNALGLLDDATRKVRDVALSTTFDMLADSPEAAPRSVHQVMVQMLDILADDAADDPANSPLTATEWDDLSKLINRIADRLDHADIIRLLRPVHS